MQQVHEKVIYFSATLSILKDLCDPAFNISTKFVCETCFWKTAYDGFLAQFTIQSNLFAFPYTTFFVLWCMFGLWYVLKLILPISHLFL